MSKIDNLKISEIKKYINMGFSDRVVAELTKTSKGTVYRVKHGILKNAVEDVPKVINLCDLKWNKESINLFYKSEFGKHFDKHIRGLMSNIKELENEIDDLTEYIEQLESEKGSLKNNEMDLFK